MSSEKKFPEIGHKVVGKVLSVKGTCSAGHKVGDEFNLSFYTPDGLCGGFYHDIFPSINVMQFGGKYPWSPQDELVLECPDRDNAVTLKIATS